MGDVIRGKSTPSAHRNLSKQLDGFARSARGIVEEHDGCLIYSGGDDVLAFLSLHRAIECAHALARRFAEQPPRATLSAGLAIVHYLEPMGAALDVAREAEKTAKRLPGKDALAIALDRRSGGTTLVCEHWEPLAPRLLKLWALHEAEAIPDGAAHEIAALSQLAGAELGPARRSEALRILRRKRARRGKEGIAQETLEWIEKQLGDDPAALGREIAIAALIAKAKAQAEPRREGRA
jgi:CRISPR-associated protein Cmr2